MFYLHEISYEQCLPLWQQLWNARISPIEPTSAMILPQDRSIREYSAEIGQPTFLGVFDGSYLVGVNSYHDVGKDQQRSRGLFVLPEYRGHGLGVWLLKETLANRKLDKLMFSFPKEQALSTYVRAGFNVTSERMFDFHESKANYYVMS